MLLWLTNVGFYLHYTPSIQTTTSKMRKILEHWARISSLYHTDLNLPMLIYNSNVRPASPVCFFRLGLVCVEEDGYSAPSSLVSLPMTLLLHEHIFCLLSCFSLFFVWVWMWFPFCTSQTGSLSFVPLIIDSSSKNNLTLVKSVVESCAG